MDSDQGFNVLLSVLREKKLVFYFGKQNLSLKNSVLG